MNSEKRNDYERGHENRIANAHTTKLLGRVGQREVRQGRGKSGRNARSVIQRSYPASTASAYLQLNEHLSPNRHRLMRHDPTVPRALHQSCLTAGSWTKGLTPGAYLSNAIWLNTRPSGCAVSCFPDVSGPIHRSQRPLVASIQGPASPQPGDGWQFSKQTPNQDAAVSRILRQCSPSLTRPS